MKIRKIHDGIVGLVITASTLAGMYLNPIWFWVPVVIGATLIQSSITGFCPVYFILNKCVDE